MLKLFCAAVVLVAVCAGGVRARRSVNEYTINLDLAPEDRFAPIFADPLFNTTVWAFYNDYFANDPELTKALYNLTDRRGPETDELQAEVTALAAAAGLPLKFVLGVQMLYELQTTMVPVENVTQIKFPPGLEALARIPWRGPGCTGIIAMCADGTVYHARDLDFSPVKIMTNLVYTGIFTKNGQEVFRSQMVAGYQSAITGMRQGPNGYTIERNTRYPDHEGGNEEMFKNLLEERRPFNGWTLRKILENVADYEDAVSAVASAPYISTEYAIMSGVKKGVIMSKDPDRVAYTQTLGQHNFDERNDYIIMTNFDFFFHDFREYFDPTGGQIGHPRRIAAQKLLNSTAEYGLTGEFLFDVINAKGVIADTIFQAVMNVELSLWNVSQPDL